MSYLVFSVPYSLMFENKIALVAASSKERAESLLRAHIKEEAISELEEKSMLIDTNSITFLDVEQDREGVILPFP